MDFINVDVLIPEPYVALDFDTIADAETIVVVPSPARGIPVIGGYKIMLVFVIAVVYFLVGLVIAVAKKS